MLSLTGQLTAAWLTACLLVAGCARSATTAGVEQGRGAPPHRGGPSAGAIPAGLSIAEIPAARARVWRAYQAELSAARARRAEHDARALKFRGKVMRFVARRFGPRPARGFPLYIALHGGGSATAETNDQQWEQMGWYYASSVKRGIYVAPRGVTNTWNLHFVTESYPLYHRLIENMIAFEGVDPDRVYLLGYSAGGDGTYQIVARMADRFAAANMSAGHHNGVDPANLYNLPFLLQVGQLDTAYKRHRATVAFGDKLRGLRQKHPGGYLHQLFVHAGMPHNFADNNRAGAPQRVLARPSRWLGDGDISTRRADTNAVTWLSRHTRDPYPATVIWDLRTTVPDLSGGDPPRGNPVMGRRHYWLSTGNRRPGSAGADRVVARLDRGANAVRIDQCGRYLRILLNHKMVDLARPVTVQVGGKEHKVRPRPSVENLERTVRERGDPSYMFEAVITVERTAKGWLVR